LQKSQKLISMKSPNSLGLEFGSSVSHNIQGREGVGIPSGRSSPAKDSAPGVGRRRRRRWRGLGRASAGGWHWDSGVSGGCRSRFGVYIRLVVVGPLMGPDLPSCGLAGNGNGEQEASHETRIGIKAFCRQLFFFLKKIRFFSLSLFIILLIFYSINSF
jgi:hypothetical protein